MSNTFSDLKVQYTNLLDKLTDSKNRLNAIPVQHNNCVVAKTDIISTISSEIENVASELRDIQRTSFDNLVIAFFGETNAGKSTIIETFRILYDQNRVPGNDGLIVGDGSSDFTKDYHEYKLNMNGIPFTLIDVPGIEGNEAEFKDVIKEALHKAHLVFYIQGHNKKPDMATAQKIKNYLGQWVYVYSVQNVRGAVCNYDEDEERVTLLTPAVKQNDELIQTEFRNILGNVYKGNLVMQAQLAMCSKGSFAKSRQDLQGYQSKLIRYFGNAENAFKFSRFNAVEQLVRETSLSYPEMIAQANRQKLNTLVARLKSDIRNINTSVLSSAKDELDRYKQVVLSAIFDSKRAIERKCSNSIEKRLGELQDELYRDVNIDGLEKYAESDQKICKDHIASDFQNILSEETKSVRERLEILRREMRFINVDYLCASSDGINTKVNTLNALNALDYDFGDFVKQAFSTAGGAASGAAVGSLILPGIGTVIGGVIGGIFGMLFGDDEDERKSNAKNEIRKAINNAKEKAKEKLPSNLENGPFKAFNDLKNSITYQVSKETGNINDIYDVVNNLYNI